MTKDERSNVEKYVREVHTTLATMGVDSSLIIVSDVNYLDSTGYYASTNGNYFAAVGMARRFLMTDERDLFKDIDNQ